MVIMEYINFMLLMLIACKLNIFTGYGTDIFCGLSAIALLSHMISKNRTKRNGE